MGHYPAVNVLDSVSRLQSRLATLNHKEAARVVREALASLERSSDLIQLGAYVQGSNPLLDNVLRNRSQIDGFLRQDSEETSAIGETLDQLQSLASLISTGNNTPVRK